MGDIEVSSKLLAKLNWETSGELESLNFRIPSCRETDKKGTNEKQIIVNRWIDR